MVIPICILLFAFSGDAFAGQIEINPLSLQYDYEIAKAIFKNFPKLQDRAIFVDWANEVSIPITYDESNEPSVQIVGSFRAVSTTGEPITDGQALFFSQSDAPTRCFVLSDDRPIEIDFKNCMVTYSYPDDLTRPADGILIPYFGFRNIKRWTIEYLRELEETGKDEQGRFLKPGSAHRLINLSPHGHYIEFVVSNQGTLIFTGGLRVLTARKTSTTTKTDRKEQIESISGNIPMPNLQFDPIAQEWMTPEEMDFTVFYAFRSAHDAFVSVPVEGEVKQAIILKHFQILRQLDKKDGTTIAFSDFEEAFQPRRDAETNEVTPILPTKDQCKNFRGCWKMVEVFNHLFSVRCNPHYVEGNQEYHVVIEGKVEVTTKPKGSFAIHITGSEIYTDGETYLIRMEKLADGQKDPNDLVEPNLLYKIARDLNVKLMSQKVPVQHP